MALIWKIAIVLAVLLGVLALVALLLPQRVSIERSSVIDAYPATVFALVNDLRNVNKWSSRAAGSVQRTSYSYGEKTSGEGASMSWRSEIADVGNGSQRITTSILNKRVDTELVFEGGGKAGASFLLEKLEGGSTRLTWTYRSDFGYDLFGRYRGLLFERWVGATYEAGLANLKALAESLPRLDLSTLDVEVVTVEPRLVARISTESAAHAGAISNALGRAYFEILQYLEANGLERDGAPLAIQRGRDTMLRIDAAIPVKEGEIMDSSDAGPVRIERGYGGKALRFEHTGPYRELTQTHAMAEAYIAASGFVRTGDSWEEYVSNPAEVPELELRTRLYYPVK